MSMWGSFFPGIGVPSGQTLHQVINKNSVAHSVGCKMLALKEGELLVDLDPINQEFVLECTHHSHDSVRKLFVIICTGERTIPEEGKLF